LPEAEESVLFVKESALKSYMSRKLPAKKQKFANIARPPLETAKPFKRQKKLPFGVAFFLSKF